MMNMLQPSLTKQLDYMKKDLTMISKRIYILLLLIFRISSFVLLFIIIGGILYLIFGNKKGHSKSKKTSEQSKPEEWLSETLVNQKAGSPKKSSKAKDE